VLKINIEAFAWDYKDMKDILPFAPTIFISKRTTNLLGNHKEGWTLH